MKHLQFEWSHGSEVYFIEADCEALENSVGIDNIKINGYNESDLILDMNFIDSVEIECRSKFLEWSNG